MGAEVGGRALNLRRNARKNLPYPHPATLLTTEEEGPGELQVTAE